LIEAMTMKMHMIQFASSVTAIQMKLMKVILMIQNMMAQRFQHCTESQLIEAMKMKMYMKSTQESTGRIEIDAGIHARTMSVHC
jgi:hypothetical protein